MQLPASSRVPRRLRAPLHGGCILLLVFLLGWIFPSTLVAATVNLTAEERQWLESQRELRVGIYEMPPLIMKRGGDYHGLSIDYLRKVEGRVGASFTLVPYSNWQKLIEATRKREVDIIVTASITLDKSSYLDFTPPYLQLQNKIILRKDTDNREMTLADMSGMTVAVVEGTALQAFLRKNYPKVKLAPVAEEKAVLEAVAFGETDAAVIDSVQARYHMDAGKLTNLLIGGDADYAYNFCFSSRNDWPVLNDILCKGLAAITESERQYISDKWLLAQQRNIFTSRTFWMVVGGTLAGMLVVHTVIWIILLRRKVARSTLDLQKEIAQLERAEDELRRLNRTLMVLGKSHEILMQFTEEKSLLAAICKHLVEVGGYGFTWVGLCSAADGTLEPVTCYGQWGEGADVIATCNRLTEEEIAHAREAISSEAPVICRNFCPHRRGEGGESEWVYGASLSIPLWGEGKVIGAMEIQAAADSFDQEEVSLLTELSENLAYAMVSIRVREEHRGAEELVRKLSQAVEQCPVTVIITDREGTIEYVNPYFTEVTGYRQEEAIGQNPRMVGSGGEPSEFYRVLWEIIQEGFEWHGELSNRKKNGELYWESASISPVRNSDGEITNFIAVKEDITERKKAYVELQEAKAAAEEATRAKSVFLANMSHEIRTPMNAVIGMLYLLQQTELTDQQHNYLSKADGAARSLLHVINDILDFSKIEAGRLQLEDIPFPLSDVVNRLVDIVAINIGPKPIEFVLAVSAAVPEHLVGDPLRLGQVLLNLASNAVKFTEQGEVLVSISTAGASDGGVELCFQVEDSGIGMTGEQTERLFDAFSQADSSTTRRFGGTGLGLAICRQLVELMGGEIRVESEVGRGSRFTFTVRFGLEEGNRGTLGETLEGLRGLRVLHLGGSPGGRLLLDQMLTSFGMVVTSARVGAELNAGEREGGNYDLLLLDLPKGGRPEMDLGGLEALPGILLVNDCHQASPFPGGRLKTMIKPLSPLSLLRGVGESAGLVVEEAGQAREDVEQSLAGMRLLLVEDNPVNQEVARGILERRGVVVDVAANGADAVEMLSRSASSYDVVLMDLQMPVMDGLVATRLIRGEPWGKEVPIIAMTASAMSEDRERCEAVGMNGHVAKPIDVTELMTALRRWLPAERRCTPGDAAPPPVTDDEHADLPEEIEGLDLKTAMKRIGSSYLLASVLKEFRRLHCDDALLIGQQLERGELREARRSAHTLKGLAGMLAAERLADLAARLESAIAAERQGEYAPCLESIADLLGGLCKSLAFLEEQQLASPSSPAVEGGPLPDDGELAGLVRRLATQLAANNLAARGMVKKLRGYRLPETLRREVEGIDAAVERLAFREASGMLVRLAGLLHITLGGGDQP